MRTFLRGKVMLLFMTFGLLLGSAGTAWAADTLLSDGDGLISGTDTPSDSNILAGSVPCNSPTDKAVLLALRHQGGDNNTFASGSTVTVSVQSTTGDVSASIGSANTITLPSGWATSTNGTQSASVSGTVTINPTVSGAGQGTVVYQAKGTETGTGDEIIRTDTQNVSWTAGTCNHAPTVSTAAANANGSEGSELTTNGAFSDADGNGTLTINKLSGAGTVTASTTTPGAWSWSHTPNDNGSGTVVVQASDGTAPAVTDSFDWSAANVDPTGTLGNNGPKAEGSAATVSFSNPSDASSVDAASLHYAFDCQGGSLSSVTYATANTTNSKSCTFNDNGSYNVTGVIIDKDGGRHSASTSVTVTNANPVVSGLSVTSSTNGVACLTGGNEVKLGFSFTDAGSADTHKYTIAWGDGNTDPVVDPATSPVANVGHTYDSSDGLGPYTITVTVTDDDGGSGSANNSANPVSFHYNIGTTLLSPVNADNSSIFKLGSTIPLKVNITDCSGTGVTGLSPDIRMIKTSSNAPLSGIDEGISTQPNDANWVMRDSGSGQYIYNLASKSLPDSSATYKAVITHNGYSVTSENYFGLKTK